MSTIYEYLDKKREDNPDFYIYDDFQLYDKLKGEDQSLPTWEQAETPTIPQVSGQKSHERKQNPDFVNQLFDLTDWTIDEGSANWAKSAYNNSITGLAYQMYNGEQRFQLDDYNPGIAEDIFSAVLSFAMPMDVATMWMGGFLGKGAMWGGSKLAGEGFKLAAKENLVKMGLKEGGKKLSKSQLRKESTEQLAKRTAKISDYVDGMLSEGSYGALFAQSAPKAAGAIGQGTTLAVFEGTRGGMQAAVDGTDVWEGIGEGVMHGGIMGGVAGFVGASLNLKHADLFNKAQKGPLTRREAQQKMMTGIGGQVTAEAGVFTAPELKNFVTDDDYAFRDLFKSFATNVGMMGILKVQHKAQSKLWQKGKDSIREFMENEGIIEVQSNKSAESAYDSLEKTMQENAEGAETPAQKEIADLQRKEVKKLVENTKKNAKVKEEEWNKWETDFDAATKKIEAHETIKDPKLKKKVAEETIADLVGIVNNINKVYATAEKNLAYYKNLGPEVQSAREGKIQEYERFKKDWKEQIMDPLNNMKEVEIKSKPLDAKGQMESRVDFREAFDLAKKLESEGNKIPMEELMRGVEGVNERGEISEEANLSKLKERADVILDKYVEKPRVDVEKIVTDVKLTQIKKQEEFKETETEAFGKDIDTKLADIRQSEKSPTSKGLSTQIIAVEGEILKNGLSDKIHTGKGAAKFTFEPTRLQSAKYEQSKDVLQFMSTELSRKRNPGEKSAELLKIADKFARFLAKKDKSLFEIEDKFIEEYIDSNPAGHREGISSLIKHISKIGGKYSGILETGLTITTGEDVYDLYRDRAKGDKVEGVLSTKAEFSPTKIDKKAGTIIVGTKTKPKIKPITDKLSDQLTALDLKAESNPKEGHKDFLFTKTNNEALITDEVNALTKHIFGKRIQPSGGEARAFRYARLQHAKNKYGKDSPEYHAIDKFSIGHGESPKVDARYSEAIEKKGIDKYVRELTEDYLKDIEKGEYVNKDGKTISMKTINKDIRQTGYFPAEIKKGLDKIRNGPEVIEFHEYGMRKNKKTGKMESQIVKTHSIEKSVAEGLFQFAIETGPRIKEIVPTKKGLDATLEYSHQAVSESYLKGEEIIKGFADSREYQAQIKLTKKLYPDFTVKLETSLTPFRAHTVIGRIKGHLIEVAKGIVQPDTIPHELSHNAVDVLEATGTPYAKKLIKEGTKLFGSQEAFVDALGKYTMQAWRGKTKAPGDLKFYNNKTMMGKMQSWVRRTMHYLGDYFGISNPQDVARMKSELVGVIGERVAKGDIPTDFMPTKEKIKTHHQLKGPEYKKTHNRVIMREKDLMEGRFKYKKDELREILYDITGERTNSLKFDQAEGLSHHEILTYEKRLKSLFDGEISNKTKKQTHAETFIPDTIKNLEVRYDISDKARDLYFSDIHNTTLEKATPGQMKAYRGYVIKGQEIKPTNNNVIDSVISLNKNRKNKGIPLWKRAIMTSGDVVRIYGGKAGKAIAQALDAHDFLRTRYKGYGEKGVEEIKELVKDKKVLKQYMHLIDPSLAKNSIDSMKKLIKNTKDGATKNKYQRELNEMLEISTRFSKDKNYIKAKDIWLELSDYYWKHLGLNINRNTKGNKEYNEIMDTLNDKFIKQYFTRRATKDVIEFLNKESSQIQRLVDRNVKDLTKSDLKRAAEALDMTVKEGEFKDFKKSKEVRDLIAEEIMAMIEFGPAKIKPAFLKERGTMLDEYVEITKNGVKKMVKSYETDIDGTMSHYVSGMSKFLATTRYFPEFTELSGRFSQRANQKINILKSMEKSDTMGSYASELIKRQLGLDYSMKDALISPYQNIAGKVTNISAVIGLSSPTAGIKNVLIQIPRSAAIYGTRNTAKAMAFALRTWRDPELYKQAIRRGETGYGSKEIIREAGQKKYVKFVFDKVNLMTQTENLNRIVLAEAGRLHFANLLGVARGSKGMFHPQAKPEEIGRMFRETWKLTDADINYLLKGDNILGTKKYHEILNFVGHQSHKAGAGATGVADLPLWMSGRLAKPMTLFMRMATSVTIDSYKNYVKPIKNGNFAPILKASMGHAMAGAGLFWMYDTFLGQQKPHEESPFLDRAMSNLWRGEFLGMFGELISPYDKPGLTSPIMEPVIIRNARLAGDELLNWLQYGKGFDEAVKDFTFKSVVAAGQLERGWNKIKHPYVSETKRIKTLQMQWEKQAGYEKIQQGQFISQRTPYYWKLKEAIMFGKSEEDIAKAYYAAFNAICTELEYSTNITSKTKREKEAKQAIESVIRHMNPINVSDDVQYRADSKRNEFLNWMSPKNKTLALKLEKEFKYKERNFHRIIRQNKWRTAYSVYPY